MTNTPTATWPHISTIDLLCFSHLRWNFVYQRPQHLLSRFAKHTRVFFIEEPIFHDGANRLQINEPAKNVYVVVPHLQHGMEEEAVLQCQRELVNDLISVMEINKYFCWYYTPMALPFSDHLEPAATVYDCMDELSAFKFAPVALKENEQRLLKKADVVFTGGYSIYEAKQHTHPNIYPFPSSIDREHFASARSIVADPADQASVPHPRFGFYGVIDERFDIDLIGAAATARPDWHFVLIGPVVKIDPATLPRNPNIHYLGGKDYKELPHYLAGWDVAIIPFAQNESTRFISPTKTPEYLAAGKPVISSPIRDVVSPYGDNALVHIASDADEFVQAGDALLAVQDHSSWLARVDAFLAGNSWDRTWSQMAQHIEAHMKAQHSKTREAGTSFVSTQSL
ncbi:glycosyltransferase family 1 protein [Flaviaesturariibacter terrae]